MTRFVQLTILLVLAAGGAVRAEDAYDLRGPAPKKGDVIESKSRVVIKDSKIAIKVEGMNLNGKMDMTIDSIEENQTVAVDKRQVTKNIRRVIKDESKRKINIGGEAMEETDTGELAGQVIVSERTGDGEWKHRLDDAKPTEKQQEELDTLLGPENDDGMFPEGKVKVGDTWEADSKTLARTFGVKVTDVKGKAKGKLLKIEKIKDEECAVIEFDMKISAKMPVGKSKIDFSFEGTEKIWRSLKTGLDVKSENKGQVRMGGDIEEDGMKLNIEVSGEMKGEGTAEFKKAGK